MKRHGNTKYQPAIASFRAKATNYKALAKQRQIDWNLTIEEAVSILQRNCYYCGAPPTNYYNIYERNRGSRWAIRAPKYFTVDSIEGAIYYSGIDRKDNTRGYEVENCVASCTNCNTAKLTMSVTSFLAWAKKVAIHQGWIS